MYIYIYLFIFSHPPWKGKSELKIVNINVLFLFFGGACYIIYIVIKIHPIIYIYIYPIYTYVNISMHIFKYVPCLYPIYIYIYCISHVYICIYKYIYIVISPTQYVPWLSDFGDFRQKRGWLLSIIFIGFCMCFFAIHLVFGIPFMMMGWHGAANGAPFIPCNLTMAHIAPGLAHRMEGLRLFLQFNLVMGLTCLVVGAWFWVGFCGLGNRWHLWLVYHKHDTLRIATYDYGSTPWYPRYLKVPGSWTVIIPPLAVIIYNNRRKFRSQTSDNMDRWKAELGRGRGKRRVEESRSEKRRSQKKEDADARRGRKVAKHCVFPMICGWVEK